MNPILKRTLTGLAVGAVVICAALFAPESIIWFAVSVLTALAGMEFSVLYCNKVEIGKARDLALFARLAGYLLGWAVVACLVVLAFVPSCKPTASDTSAKLMKGGNHKLCPTISPNKSWEGLFGSIFASCLVSCSFMGATGFGVVKSLACGVTAALVGTAGDLVESKFKRWVGVKDSSTMKITNGMGGFLDMVDSLLFAPAVLYFLMGLDF